jgi:hypothetical protein
MSVLRTFILGGKFKFAFAALLALTFFTVQPIDVSAKAKKAKYGTIKILTNPGGLLLTIDGRPRGETTTQYRAIDLEPGLHSVAVTLPNGKMWSREVEVPAGRVKCVVVNYRPLPPLPKSPCPYPVSISAPDKVMEGEIITFAADVEYGGTASLNYNWKITPSTARILTGAGTPTITVDSTGLGGQRIVATLTADDPIPLALKVHRRFQWLLPWLKSASSRPNLTSVTTARSTIRRRVSITSRSTCKTIRASAHTSSLMVDG